jgi:FlaA1/EpsC-like NDP-sugar epimerase
MAEKNTVRFLIIGAGDAGRMAAQEMLRHAEFGFVPVGFIDDDPEKLDTEVAGVRVIGTRADIPRAIQAASADELLIALPSASGQAIRGIIHYCETERVRFRVVPGIWEIIRGNVEIRQIRPVKADDLLGRETVELDLSLLADAYSGKRLLVTGAGGSIGSEICRQLLLANPEKLILVGRGENSIFEAEISFREFRKDPRLEVVIGDVRDTVLMDRVFAKHKPHAVFHAAAHKHVWLMELNPCEAVANNFLATAELVETAIRHKAERLVLISTDKAVNPRAVMGATKRMAELYLLERAKELSPGDTRLMAVRFGNVLGSRGSVVPLFQRQIARGGPVTVSHPDVARYFMTVREAALLVVEAGALGSGGEIFILDMGDQVKIAELARDLIILSGFRPDSDIPITFIGLKPGEKMREELVHDFEPLTDTSVHGLRVTRGIPAGQGSVRGATLARFAELVHSGDSRAIISEIERVVPEASLSRSLVPGPAER